MLTEAQIKSFMDMDSASSKKELARTGQRYYNGEHDIKSRRIFFINADGQLQEDEMKSNIKICHPFFRENVDQTVQYMMSGECSLLKSDIPELQDLLDEYFNDSEDFEAELYDILTGCITKGFEYAYAYKREDGKIGFQCADSLGVVEVRAKENDDNIDYVIYWYKDTMGAERKEVRRVQVWDAQQTYFYIQEDEGELVKDQSEKMNPRPHIIYKKDGDNRTYYDNFGCIPFFRLDNNKDQSSDVKPIKDLIDDYDLISCGLSNNIQDANEVLYVVKGFQGDNLDELMENIRTKKHIGVDGDGNNGVDIQTIDIPYEARKAKLDLDKENIYRFGMAFDSTQIGDGNITNIIIKSRYSLLDMKSNKLWIRLKQFLRKLLKPVLDEINRENGTDYQQRDVYFDFEPELIANESDNAQIALTVAQTRQTEIDTSNHGDPRNWQRKFGGSMDEFRAGVRALLGADFAPPDVSESAPKKEPTEPSSTPDKAENGAKTGVVYAMKTLRNGSRGTQVKVLQWLLNGKGYECGTVDGVFGGKTADAVKAYQKANGLTADGIAGKNTWNKLLA